MNIERLSEIMQDYGLYITVSSGTGISASNGGTYGFYIGNWEEDFGGGIDGNEPEKTNGIFTEGTDLEKAISAYLEKIGRTFKIPSEPEPVIIPKGYEVVKEGLIKRGDLIYYGDGDFLPSDGYAGNAIYGNYLIIRPIQPTSDLTISNEDV